MPSIMSIDVLRLELIGFFSALVILEDLEEVGLTFLGGEGGGTYLRLNIVGLPLGAHLPYRYPIIYIS